MRKLSLVLSLGSLFAAGAFAETWSGTVSDSMCGAKHEAASAADMACVKKCIKGGASAVFISDGKVYQIALDSQAKVHVATRQESNGDGQDGWRHRPDRLREGRQRVGPLPLCWRGETCTKMQPAPAPFYLSGLNRSAILPAGPL